MSIIVGRIENKFWNNSEYKFPNGFPIYEVQEELKDVEPNMNSFATGTVYLFGDNWNHCIYNGSYYSLYIQEVIDEDRKFYTYRLERDLWFDVLRLRPSVVGDLVTSNNDELLENNLNRTIAAIDNPARVITINFGEVEFDGRKSIDFKLAETPIVQKVLSLKEFNRFIDSADCSFASKGKDIDKAFYSKSKNPAVFILDILKPSALLTGGKNLLRNRVNEFVKNIHQTPKTELKLAKLALTGRNAGSPLNGKYCITQKVEGIATGEESDSYKIKQIDLSGLKDIVPINLHDLQEVIPTTNLLRGSKNGLFSNVEAQASEKFFAKIKRKAYVPICATSDRRPEELGFGFNGNWNNVRNPQSIFGEYGGTRKEEFLWWVDNLNFVIQRTGFDLYTEEAGRGAPPRKVKDYWNGKIFPFPTPGTAPDYDQGYEIFPELDNRQLVPFGFLIYGINRDFNLGFLFEYTGTRKLKEIEYINGIKTEFVENYRDENSGWSNLGSSFAGIRKSPEFLKFYLDVYNFGIMALLPGTYYKSMSPVLSYNYPSYLNTDIGGTYELSNYKYYVPKLLTSGVYKKGKLIEESLYSKAKFPEFLSRRHEKFRKLLNFGILELPEGFEIEEGDYFFSDLDYEIETRFVWEKGKEKGKDGVSLGDRERRDNITLYLRGKIAGEFSHQFRLEDFVKNEEGAGILKVREGEELFVLCTTLKGNLDVRKIQGFSRTLSLSKDQNEIVKEVEGAREQKVHFSLFKKLSDPLIPEHGEFKITDRLKAKIIKGFYEAYGYKVIGEGEVFGNGYEEDDFGDSSQIQHLFDLVGTDGYLHIAKGKISLICKDEKNLEGTEKTLNSLLYHENEGLNLSLTEKINQKTRLQFFTAPYYLNGKTTFTDQDRIFLYSSLIKPTTQQTEFEQYFLRLETQFDRIGYENISIPKRVDKALELADSVRVQSLHMQIIRDQYQYQIDQDRLDLATKRYEESIKRSTIELENQRSLSLISAATSLVAGGMSVGSLSRLYRPSRLLKGKRTNKGLYRIFGQDMEIEETEENLALLSGMQKVGHIHKGVKWTKGGFPKNVNPGGIATYGVNALVGAGRNLISDFAFRFPERERQIGVEKQLGAEELGLSSLNINTNHMDRQITAQQKLNREANIYNNPAISEREVLDQFRERKEGHGKKLRDIYLVVFVPTAEQLVALESFREEFGVMCDIPNVTMKFYEGMEPDVIRYRNLDDKAIRGIENLIIREFFKSHLMAGIKIIKTEKHTYKLLDAEEYRQQILRLNRDITEKDEKITDLQEKINKAEESCNSQKNELQKRIDSIENQLNNANTQLNQKTIDLAAKEKEFEEAKKKLEEEIKKHKIDKEEAEQKWDDCKRDYLNEKTAKNTLAKEKEELTKRLAEYDEDKKRLEWNRKELAKKRKELEAMTKDKENAQAKVTTLEAEKAKLEEQKAAVIRDYEQERDDRLSALNELRTCEGEKEKLNKRIEELEKRPAASGDCVVNEDQIIAELMKASLPLYVGGHLPPDKKEILKSEGNIEEKRKIAREVLEEMEKHLGKDLMGALSIGILLSLGGTIAEADEEGIKRFMEFLVPDVDPNILSGKGAPVREEIGKSHLKMIQAISHAASGTADTQERVNQLIAEKAEVQRKFEECKKNRKQQKEQLEAKIKQLQEQKNWEEPENLCSVLQTLIYPSTASDLKLGERENALRNLILAIIEELSWMRKAGMDATLSSKYPAMRPIFDTLMKFEEIPIVAQGENAMESEGGHEYLKYMTAAVKLKEGEGMTSKGKATKRLVDPIIGNAAAGIPTTETPAAALGIKSILDKLNGLVYKVKEQLKEQLNSDNDLSYFFFHIYPGKSGDLYEKIFGDPNIALVKRRFVEEVDCKGEKKSIEKLLEFKETTKYIKEERGPKTRRPEAPFIPIYEDKIIDGETSSISPGFSPLNTVAKKDEIISSRIHNSKYGGNKPQGYYSFIGTKFSNRGNEEFGAYVGVDKKDAWNSVMSNRRFLGSNRSKLKHLPESSGNFDASKLYKFKKIVLTNLRIDDDKKIFRKTEEYLINLEKIFGTNNYKEAAILLGIMETNRIGGEQSNKDSQGYYWIRSKTQTTNIMAAHKSLPELVDKIGQEEGGMEIKIDNEFRDIYSLLNYIGKHIKEPGNKNLDDPFSASYSNTKKLNYQNFLNGIWNANQ